MIALLLLAAVAASEAFLLPCGIPPSCFDSPLIQPLSYGPSSLVCPPQIACPPPVACPQPPVICQAPAASTVVCAKPASNIACAPTGTVTPAPTSDPNDLLKLLLLLGGGQNNALIQLALLQGLDPGQLISLQLLGLLSLNVPGGSSNSTSTTPAVPSVLPGQGGLLSANVGNLLGLNIGGGNNGTVNPLTLALLQKILSGTPATPTPLPSGPCPAGTIPVIIPSDPCCNIIN